MKAIQVNAIITSISSKKDRSLGVRFETPELSTTERAMFMELQNLNLDLTIKPLQEENVETEKIIREIETKTPSQRLRAVLFLWWKKEGEQGLFEEYYRIKMEKFIDLVKSKLDDRQ